MRNIVSETEVLIGAVLWLKAQGALPYQLSVARGAGISLEKEKQRVQETLRESGILDVLMNFDAVGPDILAVGAKQWWQIECKGAGSGKPSTQRNNFDRALASVVSYFEDHVPEDTTRVLSRLGVPKAMCDVNECVPCLGLAFPRTSAYLNELRRRVRLPLRRALNLWVLLYDPSTGQVIAIGPDREIPDREVRMPREMVSEDVVESLEAQGVMVIIEE